MQYFIEPSQVLFGSDREHAIAFCANPESFVSLPGYWGHDINNVYYAGVRLTDVTPDNFEVLSTCYGRTVDRVFYKTTVIPDVDFPSFEALDFEFARDKHSVYAVTKQIAGADPRTFEVLDWRHARDATTLYRDEVEVVGVNPRTFNIWGDYRRVGQCCFYGEYTILEADAESFHGVGGSYAVDHQQAYFCGRVLSSADPATLSGLGVGVARDAKRTFLGDTEFEGVLLDSWLSESVVRIHMRLAAQQGSGVSAMVLARQLLRDEEPVEALHWAFLAVHWTRGKDCTKAKRLLRSAHRATDPNEEIPEIEQEVCLGVVRMLLAGLEVPADSQLAHVFLELANSVQGCSPLNMTALQDEFGFVQVTTNLD